MRTTPGFALQQTLMLVFQLKTEISRIIKEKYYISNILIYYEKHKNLDIEILKVPVAVSTWKYVVNDASSIYFEHSVYGKNAAYIDDFWVFQSFLDICRPFGSEISSDVTSAIEMTADLLYSPDGSFQLHLFVFVGRH